MLRNVYSQPTYEELKQAFSLFDFMGPEHSQPTYEELKLIQAPGSHSPWLYSQPTYEELKQEIRAMKKDITKGILSLPMRN